MSCPDRIVSGVDLVFSDELIRRARFIVPYVIAVATVLVNKRNELKGSDGFGDGEEVVFYHWPSESLLEHIDFAMQMLRRERFEPC